MIARTAQITRLLLLLLAAGAWNGPGARADDASGWTPHYVESAVHERYSPVCLGPSYVQAAAEFQPIVKV